MNQTIPTRTPPLRGKHRLLVAFAIALASIGSLVHAQSWPTKPIKLLVGYPPGGVADIMARELKRDPAWQRTQVEAFTSLARGYLP